MFDSAEIKDLQKRMAQVEKTLADVVEQTRFVFDLLQAHTKKTREDDRETEKRFDKLEDRVKTLEQDLAKLKKK